MDQSIDEVSNRQEVRMPLVQVRVLEGVFGEDQKRELIGAMTDAMASVRGDGIRQFTTVLVEEVPSGLWGVDGRGYGAPDVREAMGEPRDG